MGNYKTPYRKSYLKYLLKSFLPPKKTKGFDLVFVNHEAGKGWILGAICEEIAKYYPGSCHFEFDFNNLPPAKAYFYAHYSHFPLCLKNNPHIWKSKHLVFHTHPKDIGMGDEEFNYVFNKATKVICMNSLFAKQLIQGGLDKDKVTYVIAGADDSIFKGHSRENGAVGFSTAFYERKEPDKILNIIKRMPHRKFILLGRNWEKYNKFSELSSLNNLQYITASYSEYPLYYSKMDVFVSPAILEGGPIPLIESMMSNVVPVASRTGFAPDIIRDGENGFLFDVDSSPEIICDLIEKAFELKANVRESVSHLTWENFSKNIQKFL